MPKTRLPYPPSAGATWVHTLGLVATAASPEYRSALTGVAQVLTLGGGLLFVAGGVALLVGALGSRLREIRSGR